MHPSGRVAVDRGVPAMVFSAVAWRVCMVLCPVAGLAKHTNSPVYPPMILHFVLGVTCAQLPDSCMCVPFPFAPSC